MKSLFVSAFLLLGTVCASQAQVGTTKPLSNTDNPGPDFSATSAGKVTLPDSPAAADSFAEPRANSSFSAPRLGTAFLAEPAPATPAAPSPNPRFVYGGRDDFRWQLSVAFAWFRFRSSLFNSWEFGVKTTLTPASCRKRKALSVLRAESSSTSERQAPDHSARVRWLLRFAAGKIPGGFYQILQVCSRTIACPCLQPKAFANSAMFESGPWRETFRADAGWCWPLTAHIRAVHWRPTPEPSLEKNAARG